MLNKLLRTVLLPILAGASAFAGVSVSSPTSGATVSSPTHFVASATSSTSAKIASMMIYVDNKALYTVYSNHLDKYLSLSAGGHTAVIKSWNTSGTVYTHSVSFNVGSSSSPTPTGKVFSNIDQMSSWGSCTLCAGNHVAKYSMTRGQGSPSMDGKSTKFWIGGSTPFSNALWFKGLGSVGTARHFIFDLYFYLQNPSAAEAVEFDINVAYNHRYYVFGNECNALSNHTWDTWNQITGHWVSTGVACPKFTAYKWNHVTIEVERTTSSQLHFVSFTYNGVKHYTNKYVNSKYSANTNAVSIDFQMDGDSKQTDYTVWLDKAKLTYY
jgi:hypothetical protein